jgi:hypothetical protein
MKNVFPEKSIVTPRLVKIIPVSHGRQKLIIILRKESAVSTFRVSDDDVL